MDAFRRRGIYPQDIRTLSVESLRWRQLAGDAGRTGSGLAGSKALESIAQLLRDIPDQSRYFTSREDTYNKMKEARGRIHDALSVGLTTAEGEGGIRALTGLRDIGEIENYTGLELSPGSQLPGIELDHANNPVFEVHTVAPIQRVGPDGNLLSQLIIGITQKRRWDPGDPDGPPDDKFTFRGGCTLIFDLNDLSLRYCISKSIRDEQRLAQQRAYMQDGSQVSLRATYFSGPNGGYNEPLALLHREYEHREDFYG